MKVDDLKIKLASICYKEGMRVTARLEAVTEDDGEGEWAHGGWILRIRVAGYGVADVDDADENLPYRVLKRKIVFTEDMLNDCPGMERFILKKIFETIKEYEIHEAAEWFTVGGERVFDPHKEENRDVVPI